MRCRSTFVLAVPFTPLLFLAGCGDSGGDGGGGLGGGGVSGVREGTVEEFCADFAEARAAFQDFDPSSPDDFGDLQEAIAGIRYPEGLVDEGHDAVEDIARVREALEGVDVTGPEGQAIMEQTIEDGGFTAADEIGEFADNTC